MDPMSGSATHRAKGSPRHALTGEDHRVKHIDSVLAEKTLVQEGGSGRRKMRVQVLIKLVE
jgi:hypothetical protein